MAVKYDVLVVGAGLFGSIIAHESLARGRRVLVIDRRHHIGGNCFTNKIEGINVHEYGAHIFRTNDEHIWNYMQEFCRFNNFINSPIANYNGELYNLPFNMNTFHALWGVNTPIEAQEVINQQRVPCDDPKNLEEHVLNLVGRDIYDKLVKGYTEKQWGKPCNELPASIIRRIPLRFTFDNNYFNARFQGVPEGGYTRIFEQMLDGADIALGEDYLRDRDRFYNSANSVVYTGPIDEYFEYRFGPLEYRSLRFEHELIHRDSYQGVAVMNYTDKETPYTRIIEHKHFEFAQTPTTVITREYPAKWDIGDEPYYPMEDTVNKEKYEKYAALAKRDTKVRFGGRLGEYKYYDMQETIHSALSLVETICE